MRTTKYLLFLFFLMFSLFCSRGDKLRDFYLAQTRDKNLPGWWDRGLRSPDTKGKKFIRFTDTEQIYYDINYDVVSDGKLNLSGGLAKYWYTKDNILYTCYPSKFGFDESNYEYRVSNDTLYERFPGSDKSMDTVGIRTKSPL